MSISTDRSQTLFTGFLNIRVGLHREVIHFYEDYRAEISLMDVRERFEIQACYIEALFAMEKYREVLLHVDEVIETAIDHQFGQVYGIDFYFNLLAKKAMAYFHSGRSAEATQLLLQLLYIEPTDHVIRTYYKHTLLRKSLPLVTPTRVFYISGLLTTIILMTFELLVIWPFYEELDPFISKIRNVVFIGAIVIFVFGEIVRLLAAEWQTKIKVNQILSQKNSKRTKS